MNMKPLAIVIPAFKATFLRAALDSIAAQSNKNFTLYIGDDCSPHELNNVVDEYRSKIDLVYKKFDTNYGGRDLVAQWERCIAMTAGEPYIWLFSDDDIMGEKCVEHFYDALNLHGDRNVFHFDVKIIDDEGVVTRIPQAYPSELDNLSFYKGKIGGKYMSLVVENIFSRTIYNLCGGFQKFDLAWGSDTVTWVKFTQDQGFTCIPGDYVYWRSGSQNISPNMSLSIAKRKLIAMTECFNWTYLFFKKKNVSCWGANVRGFVSRAALFSSVVQKKELWECIKSFSKVHRCSVFSFFMYLAIKVKSR